MDSSFPSYPEEKLKGVIFVSRYSIRRQFPSSLVSMDLWAPGRKFAQDDSEWGVNKSMGTLTQHGYKAAKLMGLHQRRFYESKLGPRTGCNGKLFVYCEENMPRDEYSAKGFMEGFLSSSTDTEEMKGGCEIPTIHTHNVKYILNQGSKPLNNGLLLIVTRRLCLRLPTQQQTTGRVGRIENFALQYKPLLEKLGNLLGCCDPSLCKGNLDEKGQCNILDVPYAWDSEHWFVTYTGPLYAGKYFSEWFMLTMLNDQEFAFGELSEEETLLHLMGTIEQMAGGYNISGVDHDPSANIIFYAAHDTNILFLAELLDLKWVFEGWQPNQTPPMGMLVFEVYEDLEDGEPLIGAFFHAQRPGDMRILNAETTPDRVTVTIPGYTGAGSNGMLCRIPHLQHLVARVTDLRCVAENDLRGYGQHLWQMEISHHGEGGTWKSAFSHPTLQRSHSYPNLDTIYSWVHLGITFVILFFLIHKFRLTKWYTQRCQEKRKDSERSEFGEEMCNI